jgi:hypothetical protein
LTFSWLPSTNFTLLNEFRQIFYFFQKQAFQLKPLGFRKSRDYRDFTETERPSLLESGQLAFSLENDLLFEIVPALTWGTIV